MQAERSVTTFGRRIEVRITPRPARRRLPSLERSRRSSRPAAKRKRTSEPPHVPRSDHTSHVRSGIDRSARDILGSRQPWSGHHLVWPSPGPGSIAVLPRRPPEPASVAIVPKAMASLVIGPATRRSRTPAPVQSPVPSRPRRADIRASRGALPVASVLPVGAVLPVRAHPIASGPPRRIAIRKWPWPAVRIPTPARPGHGLRHIDRRGTRLADRHGSLCHLLDQGFGQGRGRSAQRAGHCQQGRCPQHPTRTSPIPCPPTDPSTPHENLPSHALCI